MKKILVIMSFWMIAACAKRFHPEQALTKLDFEPITVTTIQQNSGTLGPCEPSICINPLNKNTSLLVLFWTMYMFPTMVA
jgi:hypothetical protein